MLEPDAKDFFDAIDEAKANEIERRFFSELLDETEQFATVAAAIAFIICRVSGASDIKGSEISKVDILTTIAYLVLETKMEKYPLN